MAGRPELRAPRHLGNGPQDEVSWRHHPRGFADIQAPRGPAHGLRARPKHGRRREGLREVSFTLNSVSKPVLQKMLAVLRQSGNQYRQEVNGVGNPPVDKFIVQGSGMRAFVTHYFDAQSAVVKILDKPFFVPESMIEQK